MDTGIRNINIIIGLTTVVHHDMDIGSVQINFIDADQMIEDEFLQVYSEAEFLCRQQGIRAEKEQSLLNPHRIGKGSVKGNG